MKAVIIVLVMSLLMAFSPLFAMTVPSESPPIDNGKEIPAYSGGMTDMEAVLVGILIAILVLKVL